MGFFKDLLARPKPVKIHSVSTKGQMKKVGSALKKSKGKCVICKTRRRSGSALFCAVCLPSSSKSEKALKTTIRAFDSINANRKRNKPKRKKRKSIIRLWS